MARITTTEWLREALNNPRIGGQACGLPADAYVFLVVLSALDVVMTYLIINLFADIGGREVNVIALAIIEEFGFGGAILMKVLCVAIAVAACELVARRNVTKARRLSVAMTVVACIPVLAAAGQLLRVAVG